MENLKIILKGFVREEKQNVFKASSNVILIKDDKNILVDLGSHFLRDELLFALNLENLKPDDVDLIILTHFHLDHIGNMAIFKNNVFITSEGKLYKDTFTFLKPETIKPSSNTFIKKTPGHTENDISIGFKIKNEVYVAAGDTFWESLDEEDPFAFNNQLLKESKKKILEIADYIVTGHGEIIKVKKEKMA